MTIQRQKIPPCEGLPPPVNYQWEGTRPTRLSESDPPASRCEALRAGGGQVNPSPTTSDSVLNMDWAAPLPRSIRRLRIPFLLTSMGTPLLPANFRSEAMGFAQNSGNSSYDKGCEKTENKVKNLQQTRVWNGLRQRLESKMNKDQVTYFQSWFNDYVSTFYSQGQDQ